MKIISLFIFLLCFPQFTPGNKCYPCRCYTGVPTNYYIPELYKWRGDKSFYTLKCEMGGIRTIPTGPEKWIPVIYIYYQPIAVNGVLKRSIFERFTQLQLLYCLRNSATSIDRDFLYPHRNSLRELSICSNNFPFLPVGLLQYAPLLETAEFKGNGIEVVRRGTVTNLKHLKWMCLSNNRINTIEIGAYSNLPALEYTEYDDNLLTFVDMGAFDINSAVFKGRHTHFQINPWFCDEKLCPFMHLAKPDIKCKDPIHLHGKTFANAVKYIGTKAHQRRYIIDEFDESVTMSCSTCTYTKLKWQKRGTEAIGSGGLPAGCEVLQADGSHSSQLVIAKPTFEHNGNYSCYNPDCITSDCPIPVIALVVRIAEPKWNFTGHEASLDEVVRYGSTGVFFILLPILIYSIIMAVAMSAYYIYVQIKRNALQQQP